MMTFSHLGATLVLGLLAGRFQRWGRREWALALGFGVLMDLDHALMLPKYLADATAAGASTAALAPAAMAAYGAGWQGFMHTPWGLLAVLAGAALARRPSRAWIAPAFWASHLFLDFVVAIRWVRFGSPLELAVILGLFAAAGALALPRRAAWWPPARAHVNRLFGKA